MYSAKKRVFISLAAVLVVAFAAFLLAEMSGSASADCPPLLKDCIEVREGFTFTEEPVLIREGYPAAPVLTGPAANHTMHGPNVTFTWDAGQGGPQPTSFRVCVTEVGTHCGSPASIVYSNITPTARSFTPPGGGLPASKF